MRGRPFPRGKSGNPGGRPKVIAHVRDLAREHTAVAIATLVSVMKNAKSPLAARVAAANAILDRGYGRPGFMTTVDFRLPELVSANDALRAISAISAAVAAGDMAPTEAVQLCHLVEAYTRAIETVEFDRRIRVLEERETAK